MTATDTALHARIAALEAELEKSKLYSTGSWASQRENDALTIEKYEAQDRAEAAEAALAAERARADALERERDEATASVIGFRHHVKTHHDHRVAAEARADALAKENERLKIALADAIRRPLGVIPASADELITYGDIAAAEERRTALTKEAGNG